MVDHQALILLVRDSTNTNVEKYSREQE